MLENNIRLMAIGDLSRLLQGGPGHPAMKPSRRLPTATGMTLTLALSYGGRDDILQAVRRIMTHCQDGNLAPEEILTRTSSPNTCGHPTCPIPTSSSAPAGRCGSAIFSCGSWPTRRSMSLPPSGPTSTREELVQALLSYQNRERRFGMTSEQIKTGIG